MSVTTATSFGTSTGATTSAGVAASADSMIKTAGSAAARTTTTGSRAVAANGQPTVWTSGRPLPGSVYAAMDRAAHSLTSANRAATPGEQFVAAHVAALQVVAAVLAARPRPAGRSRTMNAWLLLERAAPDLADWATYFSAGAAKRAGVEAGLEHSVTPMEAAALQNASEQFFHEIADRLGLTPAVLLGAVGYDAA